MLRTITLSICLTGFHPLLCQGLKLETMSLPLTNEISVNLEIGDLQVPENRTIRNSRLISIKVARIKAQNPQGLPPVTYFAGGPGGSAINELRISFIQKILLELNQKHDIVLIDQRGTGNSTPKMVWEPDAGYRKRNQHLIDNMFASKEGMLELLMVASRDALSHFKDEGFDLLGYNTIESAHDVKAVCEELGIRQLHLLGFSYGTHLALATMRAYPDLVASAISVGTEGANHTYKLPRTYDKQIESLSDLVARDEDIKKLVPDMKAAIDEICERLEQKPIQMNIKNNWTNKNDEVTVGKFGFQLILKSDIGDRNDFIFFPKMLYEMSQENYDLFRKYVTKRYDQYQGGVHGMATIMNLSSGVSKTREKAILRQSKSSLLGNAMNFPEMELENIWEHRDLGDDYRSSFKFDKPVLFISGTLDSNTPPFQVDEVAKSFTSSHHLVVKYAGHESMLPNKHVQQVIFDFIDNGTTTVGAIDLGLPKFKKFN